MDLRERIQLAALAWEACRRNLPPELRDALAVMGDGADRDDKTSPGCAKLCVRPREKIPARFWGGWTWYELIVGHIPHARPPGLNVGGVSFLHACNQKASGSGAYVRAVDEVLHRAAGILGADFHVEPPGGKFISLRRVFKIAHFPAEEAGQEFARLIATTLPLLQMIPDAA